MAINKVVYGDDTLIDLTNTTATADRIVSGTGAYGADGVWIDGTLTEVFPSDDNPVMDGTASPGVSINYSRADHVHPHDSSIPTKTSDLTNDSGFITGITSADVTTALGYTPPRQDTTYQSKAAASGGTEVSLVTTGEKYIWNNKGNGTITGINMNGASKGTSGVIDLGTVITAHQDISGKADVAATVSNVEYDSTNKKITKTINRTTSDVVSVATIKADLLLTKRDVKLDEVENVRQYSELNPPPYPGLNLLDNPYFVGGGSQLGYGKFPINQRGKTSYNNSGYTIDRWMIGAGGSLTVNTTGITFNSGKQTTYTDIKQFLPNGLVAGHYVVSALINVTEVSGTVRLCIRNQNYYVVASTPIINTGLQLITLNFNPAETINGHSVCIMKNNAATDYITANLIAMKFEVGSTQTLIHLENGALVLNEIPDYAQELAKCQAYFIKTSLVIECSCSLGANGANPRFFIPLPVTMAKTPVFTKTNTGDPFTFGVGTSIVSVGGSSSSIQISGGYTTTLFPNGVRITFQASGAIGTAWLPCTVEVPSFELSAES